jgi:glycosyltransferase involved in cell wall biosynthesis
LKTLEIHEIHLHHLIDFPPQTAATLVEACRTLGISLRVAVHDYYAICPRVNFVNAEGRYCGEPAPAECDKCLAADGLAAEVGPIEEWRRRSVKLLSHAQQVVVPSEDVARRLIRLGPKLPVRVEPHEASPPAQPIPQPLVAPGQVLRVLVIGAISRIKGFDVVRGMASIVRDRNWPLSVSLLGYSMDDPQLAALGVELLGRYFDNELQEKIAAHDPHLILIPSIWPETYCYVLSSALASGRRVAVFDLGAQVERTRAHDPLHMVLPLALADDPEALSERLLVLATMPEHAGFRVAA